jgi:hypothetical protein
LITATRQTAPPREAGAEPLRGYCLLERLGAGGYGEVWRCAAPGGLPKAIKFVSPDAATGGALDQELTALERVRALRHPYLLGLDRAELVGGELLLVMELADGTLLDRAGAGRIGPDELLPLLGEAAEALDLLAAHGLQHLDVKPANLFLVGGHLKVGDFGLAGAIGATRAPAAHSLAGVTPRYAAPEVILRGAVSAAADQYALGLVAYELLTGRFPFPAGSARRLAVLHAYGAPELSAINPAAGVILARALAKDPADRFPSCREFVHGLAGANPAPAEASDPGARRDTGVIARSAVTVPAPAGGPAPVRLFDRLGRAGGRASPKLDAAGVVREVVRDWLLGSFDAGGGGDPAELFCRFPVRGDRAELVGRLRELAGAWGAALAEGANGSWELTLAPPTGLLRRLLDRPGGLRVVVTLPDSGHDGRGEATAACPGAGRAEGGQARAAEALAAVREALGDGREGRRWARYPVDAPALAYPVGAGGRVGPGVEVRCSDLSAGGARLESASDLPPAGRYYLRFPCHPSAAEYGLLCQVVRRRRRAADDKEIGCRFSEE